MTKEDLIALALQFRTLKLWEYLDDSMIFGVRLSDGEVGYCCIMGNGGQHYALALYKGISGFSTYLNSLNGTGVDDRFELFQTYDCMNCEYENAPDSNLTSAQKKLVRAVAGERHIKMCRPKGYPEFIRYDRGLIRPELNENEIENLGMALKAGIEVAKRVEGMTLSQLGELGFAEDGYYPNPSGGDRIPLLEMQEDGEFKWSQTVTPKAEGPCFPVLLFNNQLSLGRLKAMKRMGAFQCKVMHLQSLLKCDEGLYYPLIIALIDDNGMAYPVMQTSDNPHAEDEILEELAFTLISMEAYPEVIMVDDEYSETFLTDFCKKAEIKLEMTSYLPELEELAYMLRARFGI